MPNQSSRQQTNKEMDSDYYSQHISLKDDCGVAEDWVRTGDYNPRSFAKYLPNTAKELSQGHSDCDRVSSTLESIYMSVIHKDKTASLRHLACLLAVVIVPRSLSPLTQSLLSIEMGRMIYLKTYARGQEGSVIRMESSLSEVVKGIRSCFASEEGINVMARELGVSFETFRRDNDLFNFTEADFVTRVLSCMDGVDIGELWRECEEMRRAANGFTRITSQYHPTFYKCWKCSNVCEKISHCGGCEAAVYCSRECQVAAWKGGHKAKCARLKMAHNLYLTGVEELGKAHYTGMIDGFELCPTTDVLLLNHCMSLIMMGQERDPSARSMKTFYENLGRIIRGEWWVYDMSDQTGETLGATDDTRIFVDIHSFLLTTKFLIFDFLTKDWFDSARKAIGTDDPEKVTEWADPFFRKNCGPPISAERLLAFYLSPLSSPSPLGRVNYTISCYDSLREVHNACN